MSSKNKGRLLAAPPFCYRKTRIFLLSSIIYWNAYKIMGVPPPEPVLTFRLPAGQDFAPSLHL